MPNRPDDLVVSVEPRNDGGGQTHPESYGDNPIMLEAAAALGRSHAQRGFEPYWQAIFSKRQAAYIRAYNARKVELAEGLTAEIIDAGKTPKGGWARETLAAWGVPWPPPKGWKAALIKGREQ